MKRGLGSVFQPKLKSGERSARWVIKFYAPGRGPVWENTGLTDKRAAERMLKERLARVALSEAPLPRADRVRYEDVAGDLKRHYEATGSRDLQEYARRVQHLDAFFAGRRIGTIGQPEIDAYVVHRLGQGVVASTVRRELGTLTKMLRLAYKNRKLLRLPLLEKPKEGPARTGFFERDQFAAVRRQLPADLQVASVIAYVYGWRMQSEVLALERRHVDLAAGTLRLDTSKNGEGREVTLTAEVRALLAQQLARVDALQRELKQIVPWVFPHLTGGARLRGTRIRDFRKVWSAARKAAGCPGMHRHDLRRTAVRNMVNAGVSERVAMTMTGHKTRSVFDRYHIVSPADLVEAARKLDSVAFPVASGPAAAQPAS